MTAPDRLALTTRDRKARREVELRKLAALMRERGGLAALPPPRPLHKMAGRGQASHHYRRDTTMSRIVHAKRTCSDCAMRPGVQLYHFGGPSTIHHGQQSDGSQSNRPLTCDDEADSRSRRAYPRDLNRSRFRYATVPRGTSKVGESRGSATSADMITFGTALTARVGARPRRRKLAAVAGKSATEAI